MAEVHRRLKLGKRASFVKSKLKQVPQEDETWEADFRPLAAPAGQTGSPYLGLAIALPRGNPLEYMPLEYTPTVNDLADLLADAMRRPLTGSPRRPRRIHFRPNVRWEELFPHLKELGIEVTLHDELAELDEQCLDFCREMRRMGPARIIMMSPAPVSVDQQFPALGEWVRQRGWIEVGRRKGGFVARALDDGGLVFENSGGTTLAEAMAALEAGLAGQFTKQEAAEPASSPPKRNNDPIRS